MTQPHSFLGENVAHFARLLRGANMAIALDQVMDARQALTLVDLGERDAVYWTLHAHFVRNQDQHALFDQAFRIFWRGIKPPSPSDENSPDDATKKEDIARRLWDSLQLEQKASPPDNRERDAALSFSADERLRRMDFESMSLEDERAAQKAIAALALDQWTRPSRRWMGATNGPRLDMRRSLRAMARAPEGLSPPQMVARRPVQPPLVALIDVSGSMSRYSRMALHYLHALLLGGVRLHVFLFGTQLTNVTRPMRLRDRDAALRGVSDMVPDWSGGTRIGFCLEEFNRHWARRVLGQNAIVLFLSDGLDREDAARTGQAMERLGRSARRLIWLNPLLRWDGFEPKAAGIKAILPHIDEFRPVHNFQSLMDLTRALNDPVYAKGNHHGQWRHS